MWTIMCIYVCRIQQATMNKRAFREDKSLCFFVVQTLNPLERCGGRSRTKNSMKRLLLSLLTIMAASFSWASTGLIVHQKSGGTVEFAFSEKPIVTYSDGYLVISVQDGVASVSYPLSDMQKFTFGELSSDYTRIIAPKEVAPQPTYIYNIGGMLVRTLQPSDDGSTPATLDGLPAGTYIIKNGTTTYKTTKK